MNSLERRISDPQKFRRALWIAWADHRRSRELAGHWGIPLRVIRLNEWLGWYRVARYILLSISTTWLILVRRPKVVFCQNPSLVLASLLCVLKAIRKFVVVVDRHSNFKLGTEMSRELRWRVFHLLSRFSLKRADVTIVTNEYLRGVVNQQGGFGVVLQDKIPILPLATRIQLKGEMNVTFIASFDEDEPFFEVLSMADLLGPRWAVYVTGRPDARLIRRGNGTTEYQIPPNIVLTGFIPEPEYQSLLWSSDVLLILTSQEHLLNCGIYEGLSLGKPMVVSDTNAIREYFRSGVVYTKNRAVDLVAAIQYAIACQDKLGHQLLVYRRELSRSWELQASHLAGEIENRVFNKSYL